MNGAKPIVSALSDNQFSVRWVLALTAVCALMSGILGGSAVAILVVMGIGLGLAFFGMATRSTEM